MIHYKKHRNSLIFFSFFNCSFFDLVLSFISILFLFQSNSIRLIYFTLLRQYFRYLYYLVLFEYFFFNYSLFLGDLITPLNFWSCSFFVSFWSNLVLHLIRSIYFTAQIFSLFLKIIRNFLGYLGDLPEVVW